MNFGAALIGGLAIYVFKPLVLLYIVILLFRFGKISVPGRSWIWAGLWCFFVAEGLCAVETYYLHEVNPALDVLHNLLSASAVGLISMGAFQFFDTRHLYYISDSKPCFMMRFCAACPRRAGGRCIFHGIVLWSVLMLVLMAAAPLLSDVQQRIDDPSQYQLPWPALNDLYSQKIGPFFQQYLAGYSEDELCLVMPRASIFIVKRVLPVMAIIGIGAAFILLLLNKVRSLTVFLFFAGFGSMAFSYYNIILYEVNPFLYIGALGEEITELIGLFMLVGLWRLMKSGQPKGENA